MTHEQYKIKIVKLIDYATAYYVNNNPIATDEEYDKLNREIFGKPQSNEIYKDRDFKNNPIYLSPTYRLKSELVLCLALFHHLVLGDGMNIGSCLDLLSKMTEKRLVLEFIDLEDPAIKNEPTFFKNLEKLLEIRNTYKHNELRAEKKNNFPIKPERS